MVRWLSDDEERAWRALQLMELRLEAELARDLAEAGDLSYSEYLVLVGLTISAVQIVQNGFAFFVFRNTGAGAGNPQNLQEDQGPGQSDAPGAHHSATPSTPKPTPSPSKTN